MAALASVAVDSDATTTPTDASDEPPLFAHIRANEIGAGLPIHTPIQEEAVLLGAAILGAAAGGAHPSVEAAMSAMSAIGDTVLPSAACAAYHERKYKVFRRMEDDQRAYRRLMAEGEGGA